MSTVPGRSTASCRVIDGVLDGVGRVRATHDPAAGRVERIRSWSYRDPEVLQALARGVARALAVS
jgi:hypothetical protein